MMKYQVVIRESCERQEGGGIVVEGGDEIDFITVFNKDGTLIFEDNGAEEITLIDNLLYDVYLVVVNLKNGNLFTDIINLTQKKQLIH